MGYRALFEENRKLKAEIDLLRDVLDNVASCIYAKDVNSRYIYANAKSCELLGASFDEILGQDDTKFFETDTATQIVKNDRLVLDSGQPLRVEMTALAKSRGEPRNLVVAKAPLRNKQGQLIGVCGITTVMTDIRHTDSQ